MIASAPRDRVFTDIALPGNAACSTFADFCPKSLAPQLADQGEGDLGEPLVKVASLLERWGP
jgi:hypothetical protein